MPGPSLSSSDLPRTSFHPDLPDSLVPRRRPGFHLKKIRCCMVLQDENEENILKLNRTGALLWNLCTEEYNIGELLALLGDVFPDAREEINRDTYRVLDTLREYEVIDLVEG